MSVRHERFCETRPVDALRDLRMHAVREALGEIVGADQLINAALNALMHGVESPSLPLLAGLSRQEEGDAHELFRAVISELALAPPTPINSDAERWRLVRWLCEAIAEERIEPEVAGRLIWFQGWNELDYPDALQPLVGWVSEWEDWSPSWGVDRDHYRRLIVEEARRLLAEPWPPQ